MPSLRPQHPSARGFSSADLDSDLPSQSAHPPRCWDAGAVKSRVSPPRDDLLLGDTSGLAQVGQDSAGWTEAWEIISLYHAPAVYLSPRAQVHGGTQPRKSDERLLKSEWCWKLKVCWF